MGESLGGGVRKAVATLWHSPVVGEDSLSNTIPRVGQIFTVTILSLLANVCAPQCWLSPCRNCLWDNYHFYRFHLLQPGLPRATKKTLWCKRQSSSDIDRNPNLSRKMLEKLAILITQNTPVPPFYSPFL